MAFRCDSCGEAQPAGAKPIKTVAETRDRVYEHRYRKDSYGEEIVWVDDLCRGCAGVMTPEEMEGAESVAAMNEAAAAELH